MHVLPHMNSFHYSFIGNLSSLHDIDIYRPIYTGWFNKNGTKFMAP